MRAGGPAAVVHREQGALEASVYWLLGCVFRKWRTVPS